MEKKDLRNVIFGFIGGVILTLITAAINYRIHRENKISEERQLDRKDKELLASQIADLQSAYIQLKHDFRNRPDCESANKHLSEISNLSIRIISNSQATTVSKAKLIELNSELDFIKYNYCKILDFASRHGGIKSLTANGKKIEGFFFDGNLRKTDTIVADLMVDLFTIDNKLIKQAK